MGTTEQNIKKSKLIREIESTASALLTITTDSRDIEWLLYVIGNISTWRSVRALESIRETLLYI